jgi:hypothetical protein
MSKSMIKTILICFFSISGIIHFEFVPKGTTVNQTFYVEVLKMFIYDVRRKRRELWRDRSFVLHHDNAQAYFRFECAVFSRKMHQCHGSSAIFS